MARWPYLALHDEDGRRLMPLTVDGPKADPFLVSAFDAGAVDVREDVADDPAGDGTDDQTMFTGASGVTVELTAIGTADRAGQLWLDDLRGLCHPANRHYLHAQAVDWPGVRRLLVRGASAPRDFTDLTPDVQFQWKAPLGYFEDAAVTTVTIRPSGETESGLSAPVSAPVFTPPADPPGGRAVQVAGTRGPWWELDIYGPCVGPVLTSDAGWQVAGTTALVVAAGHFVRIQPHTSSGPQVWADADPDGDMYGQIDFGLSSWQPLEVGLNLLTLSAYSAGDGFHAVLRYRARYP